MKGSSVTFSDFIKTKIEELKSVRGQKKELEAEREKVNDKINALQTERDNLQKTLPNGRENQNPENIRKTIEDMQRRYETTTLKPAEEKKMLADMKKMKESIPNAQRLIELKPIIDKLYESRKDLGNKIHALRDIIDSKSAEIDEVKKEQNEVRDQRDDIKQQLDKFQAEIDKIKLDLNSYYEQKDQLREDFHKAKFDFEVENDLIRHNDWIAREKERLVVREKAKEERVAARKQQLADRPNPYLKEIETCERLIAYIDHLKKKLGLVQTEESIQEERKQIINSMAKEDVQKKLQDGKIEQVLSKKEREEQATIRVGGGKKGGKKPKVRAAEEQEDVFQTIDISLLQLFGFLKVSPPTDKGQLDGKIEELKNKLKHFETEGDKRLQEEAEQILAGTFEEPEEDKEE